MIPMIAHFNTAGAGLLPIEAWQAMSDYLHAERKTGAYETEQVYQPILQESIYRRLGQLLHAPDSDIALFDSATRAWVGCIQLLKPGARSRVWVTPYEYAGNLIALHEMQTRYGFTLEVVPLLNSGDLDLDWMRQHIDHDVVLVSVVHIPSGCGIVNPVNAIGEILRHYSAIYIVDACQSTGLLHLDVAAIGCDILTAAGRKYLCGPRGTGFAYLSPRFRAMYPPTFTDLHAARIKSFGQLSILEETARRYELAERNPMAIVGLDAALAIQAKQIAPCNQIVYEALRQGLQTLPDVHLVEPGSHHAGIIAFEHETRSAPYIVQTLRRHGINAWVADGSHTPLYLLACGKLELVRLSVHTNNTCDEAARLLALLSHIGK